MIYVGIDVASRKHDCCILDEKGDELGAFIFKNNKQGFEELMSKISSFSNSETLSDVRIGLESTGHYSINIQNYLLQKRLSVKIFNPLHVNLMRKAQSLRKTKTDKSDSKFGYAVVFGRFQALLTTSIDRF